MSALSPKADICSALAYVRFGPKPDIRIGCGLSSDVALTHEPLNRSIDLKLH
jgi:hypothetical protein